MRFVIPSGLAPFLLLSAPAAMAEDAAPAFKVSGTATLISDYRFRGISQTDKAPAVQGTIGLSHDSGFYIGTWASSIDLDQHHGPTEVDLYGGWARMVSPRDSVDIAIAYYAYPGHSGAVRTNFMESSAKLTHDFGPLKATMGTSYAWDQAVLGGDSLYLYGEAAAPVPHTPLTLKAHAGRSKGALSPRAGGYYDWSLGADAAFGPVTLSVAYVDTDLKRNHQAAAGGLFSISAGF